MSADPIGFHLQGSTTWKEAAMDQQTIAYGLTWVGTAAWVLCFWWMHRISTRQDALLTEESLLVAGAKLSISKLVP